MTTLHIHRHHEKTPQAAYAAVEAIAQKLNERFQLVSRWNGETLLFERSGVNGEIALAPGIIYVTVHLSFLLAPLQGRIEAEINRYLGELLD